MPLPDLLSMYLPYGAAGPLQTPMAHGFPNLMPYYLPQGVFGSLPTLTLANQQVPSLPSVPRTSNAQPAATVTSGQLNSNNGNDG